jgi:uncharacterized protein YndB with AHSA1/START domain
MSPNPVAVAEYEFRCRADAVYQAWLSPALARRWMAAALESMGLPGDMRTVEIDPRVGGGFRFEDQRGAVLASHWGTYLVLEPPRTISFTWITDPADEDDPSVVTVQIESLAAGCVATVTQPLRPEWRDYVEQTTRGWSSMLRAMAACV